MARTTMAMAMAMKAVLLVALLSLFPCATFASVEESMPALLAHIREIQRLAKAAHGESVEADQPVQLDSIFSSLGVTDAAESEQSERSERSEPEPDPTSQLFAHIHAVQRKAQEAAEEWEKLNGEDKEQLVEDVKEEETEADPATDALVQARFGQLDAALKFLNNKNDAENTQWSADADDDAAINILHKFVLETDQSYKHDEVADVESEDQTDVAGQLFAHINAVKRKAQEAEKLNGEEKEELVELQEEESDPATGALVQTRFNQLNAALKFLNNKDDAESTQWSADADEDAINLLHQFVQNQQLETDPSQKHDFQISSLQPDAAPVESEPEADPTSQLFAHIHAVQRKAAEDLEKLNGEEKEEVVELVKEESDPATDALVQARFNQLNAALRYLNNKDDADNSQWSANADDDAINLLHQFVQNRQLETDQRQKHAEIASSHPAESEPEADATSQLFAYIHAVQRKAAEEMEKLNGEEKEELLELVKEEADPAMDTLVQARFTQLNAALKFLNYKDDAESTQWSADADDDAINLLHQFVQSRQLETDQSHKHDEIGHKCDHDHVGSDAQHHDHGHSHGESFKSNKIILPEEIAEEEDLLQHSFDGENHASGDPLIRSSAPNSGVWLRAMSCSLLVSLASLICLILLPCIVSNGKLSENVVNALASFGAGAMLGDAFLHQIPHAYGNTESPHLHQPHHDHIHSHAHDHISSAGQGHAHSLQDLSIGLAVLGGILVFFIVEKVVRRYEELSSVGGQRTLGHSHHHQKKKKKAKQLESHIAAVEVPGTFENKEPNSLETKSSDTKKRKNSKKKDTASGRNQISAAPRGFVTGYLNLFSDAVHNFTDGMALGSAFLLHGTSAGWSRTLFLLAHELPQEVGDFGILVKSGFSVFEALSFNFLSALVALAGTATALVLGGSSGHSSLVEGFIAGGFIYMSVGGVMPSMHDQGSSLSSTLSQLVPLVLGMGVAIAISLAE